MHLQVVKNSDISTRSYIHQIPILEQAIYLLQSADSVDGIKLTEKGALGRNFVQAFWDKHLSGPDEMPFRPTRELECPEVTRVHSLLLEAKYVGKYKRAVHLTERGKLVLEGSAFDELYLDLLTVGVFHWNWAYEDRYPDFEFIQDSAPQLIEALVAWPAKTVISDQIFSTVFGNLDKVPMFGDYDGDMSEIKSDIKEQLERCFNVRFFRRFCVPFGLLKDVSGSRFDWQPSDEFEKTEFFISAFPNIITKS